MVNVGFLCSKSLVFKLLRMFSSKSLRISVCMVSFQFFGISEHVDEYLITSKTSEFLFINLDID